MTCAVVSLPYEHRAFIECVLGGTVGDTISGGGRIYALTFVEGLRSEDVSYEDLDGGLLTECRFFDDEAAARAWIADDIAKAVGE